MPWHGLTGSPNTDWRSPSSHIHGSLRVRGYTRTSIGWPCIHWNHRPTLTLALALARPGLCTHMLALALARPGLCTHMLALALARASVFACTICKVKWISCSLRDDLSTNDLSQRQDRTNRTDRTTQENGSPVARHGPGRHPTVKGSLLPQPPPIEPRLDWQQKTRNISNASTH